MDSQNNVHDSLLPGEDITPVNQRVTSRFLTKFEISVAVSLRAKDIVSGQFKYGTALLSNSSFSAADELAAAQKTSKKRKTEESSDDGDDSDSDSDIKKTTESKNNKNKKNNSFLLQQDDNPMLGLDNQIRVKSMPMIYSDPVMIAKHELVAKKLPFIVKRCIGADLPPQSVLNTSAGKRKYRVECIPISDLEVDIRAMDLGEWIF